MLKQRQAKWMLSLSMIIFGTIGLFTRNIEVTSGIIENRNYRKTRIIDGGN